LVNTRLFSCFGEGTWRLTEWKGKKEGEGEEEEEEEEVVVVVVVEEEEEEEEVGMWWGGQLTTLRGCSIGAW